MTNETDQLQREDEEFTARIGQQLRNSADELDAATLSRLNRARQVALETMDHPVAHPVANTNRGFQWLPVGTTALLAVIAIAWWQGRVPEQTAGMIVADETIELELLFDEGDLAMYEELEFFAWLSEDELENIG
jgi:hypothetical protein